MSGPIGNRIPPEFRKIVNRHIRVVMNPYVKGCYTKHEHFYDVAAGLKVSDVTVYNWYEGWCLPTLYNLVRFANYYEVSVDYLLGRTAVKQLAHELKLVKSRTA